MLLLMELMASNSENKTQVVKKKLPGSVGFLSVFSGSGGSFSEASYKPSFLPDEELKHLVLKVNVPLTEARTIYVPTI